MDWESISANWAHWKGRIQERWGRLSDDTLDGIAGRREQLLAGIQQVYGLGATEAERQLRTWERNLAVDEIGETELLLDEEEDESSDMNGRG